MNKVFSTVTNYNRLHFVTNLILSAFLSILTVSCSNDDNQPPVKEEEPPIAITEISEEIKDLIYFKGNEKAPAVLINIQGGPDTKLDTDMVNLIFESFKSTDLLSVNVHQAQTLDSTIVKGNDITLDEAVSFNLESIEVLDKVISYFKGQGRTVYVLGNSFGAFMTQELIVKKGIDTADKYLIMTGRLDINDIAWQAFSEGRVGFFENGVTPIIDSDPDPDVKERNINRITAGLGMNRYTQLLSPIEDLSNVTYVYGATDQAVGSLTADEVQFLESKNATVIAGGGGHDDTFWEFIEQGFKEAFGLEVLP